MKLKSWWDIGPTILMYHSINDNSNDPFSVSIVEFRKQITWLCSNGFEIISLSFLIQLLQASDYRSLRNKVVITFDDGCKDFVTNALPVLLENEATATVFLVTGMLGATSVWNRYDPYVQLMTENEAHYIRREGINLGSHTVSHVNLKQVGHLELLQQLKESYNVLTSLGESFHTLSYPWGQYSHQIIHAVKSCGYECALIAGEQSSLTYNNLYFLPRISMSRAMELERFESLLYRANAEKIMRRIYQNYVKKLYNN